MGHAHLIACPTCARHVRASETSCRFCGGTLSDELRATPKREGPAVVLGRAALYAFGIGAISVPATACSKASPSLTIPGYGSVPTLPPMCDAGSPVMPGSNCEGGVYVALPPSCGGWLFCDNGFWEYTEDNPVSDGYSSDSDVGDGSASEDANDGSSDASETSSDESEESSTTN